jgi:predicted O-methyltransferase YrrM
MKIGCFVMMRNESPILGAFLDQIKEFFDTCVILDHSSCDKSTELIKDRNMDKIKIFYLKTCGYPQAEVSTYFGHNLLNKELCDYVFFLDCDEFLPYNNRKALESFLNSYSQYDVIRVPWLNVCPERLDGVDIFKNKFYSKGRYSEFYKVIISKSIIYKDPGFNVMQGYHDVDDKFRNIKKIKHDKSYFLHIPIQSYVQFGFKIANGHNRLIGDQVYLSKNNGYHWVELARKFADGKITMETLRYLAVNYPDLKEINKADVKEVDFKYPYIKTCYHETQEYVGSQISSLIGLAMDDDICMKHNGFSVCDENGEVVFGNAHSYYKNNDDVITKDNILTVLGEFEDSFSELIEPLFDLPTNLPVTAWKGHIPFMFVLFKIMKPKKYVELGVHNGASLIAACTAAKTYNINSDIYGIDSWEGDIHAGGYDGDKVYLELKSHLDANFSRVTLIRSYFAEARSQFIDDSIDILHIDGLHTYEAVKEDFSAWFKAMSPSGVIILHDISVYDKGFGVYRLWTELKKSFVTIEFNHSYGLGVVFLDPYDTRIASLVALASHGNSLRFYQGIVSMIADVLPERMKYYQNEDYKENKNEKNRYKGIDSIKPIRKLRKSLRKRFLSL